MSISTDHRTKRARLLDLLDRHGAQRLVLTSATSIGWYLDGARTHISLAAPPIVTIVVDHAGDHVLTTDNESGRLVAEELPDGVDVQAVPWFCPLPVPSGPGTLIEDAVADDLRALRVPLLPLETDRFRLLGRETARLLTELLTTATPEQSEQELAAIVTGGIVGLSAEPLVVLVGGTSRSLVRHPLPTGAPLGRRALVVVCARRHGLIVNVSRSISFGEPPAAEIDAHARILAVEAAYLNAIVPGRRLSEVFAEGRAAYARNGFEADEWTNHHQGGVAGYAGRDPRATEDTDDLIAAGQAFAWNPTGQGAKVEDTVLLTDAGLEVLTTDPEWPVIEVDGRARPDLLRLSRSDPRVRSTG